MESNTTERFLTMGITERNSLQKEANDPRILATSYMMYKVGRSLQGLSVPFACVGSGDPVRVLRLYTTNTLDIL